MKKLLLFTIVFFSFVVLGNAQGVNLGIKAGLNMATLSGDVGDVDMKAGLHVGAFLDLKASDKFAISPELLFSMQGASDDENANFNYVNIPVLAKIYLADFLNIHVGPQAGFLLSAKVDDVDMKEAYKDLDISAVAGVGIDLPMGLTGGLRYNVGLGNILDKELADLTDTKVTNQVFQVYVGLRFL